MSFDASCLRYLRPLVSTILQHAETFEWSLQGFGMFRLYLSKELRLHVWSPEHAYKDVDTVHTHPWDFESIVLQGSIRNRRYVLNDDPNTPQRWQQQKIVCGPCGGPAEDAKPVQLEVLKEITWNAGERYCQFANEIHESIPQAGTITLVRRTFHADTEHAHVFFATGRSWRSAIPRPATRDEVLAMKNIAGFGFEVQPG